MPTNVTEKLEQAKVAEEAGLLATALNLHRVCYLAARPNSAERRVRMADMLRLRKKGAEGSIPGDRSGDHPAHMKLRRDLSPEVQDDRWLDIPSFLRRRA